MPSRSVLEWKVIVLERKSAAVNAQALSWFAARAQRAVGLGGEVNIRITSSGELRKLNRRFRRKDQPTDVLSFPSAIPELAGDIAISADIAQSSAADLGHPIETELKVLVLHGLLHLAGYDHEKDSGDMQARETELRRQFKLPTGLIERTNSPGRQRKAAAKPAVPREFQGVRP
jgi:probable rRNA maturation factor